MLAETDGLHAVQIMRNRSDMSNIPRTAKPYALPTLSHRAQRTNGSTHGE